MFKGGSWGNSKLKRSHGSMQSELGHALLGLLERSPASQPSFPLAQQMCSSGTTHHTRPLSTAEAPALQKPEHEAQDESQEPGE